MKLNIKCSSIRALAAALLSAATIPATADVITDWNLTTLNATKTAGLNSNLGSRIDAIEAIAVYDSVNSIRRFGTPYHYHGVNSGSAQAAAAQAFDNLQGQALGVKVAVYVLLHGPHLSNHFDGGDDDGFAHSDNQFGREGYISN
jgi:hypothetical protein